jgi:hypothetical protein
MGFPATQLGTTDHLAAAVYLHGESEWVGRIATGAADHGNLRRSAVQRVLQLEIKFGFTPKIKIAKNDDKGFEEVAFATPVSAENNGYETGVGFIEVY